MMKLTVLTADAAQIDPAGKVHTLGLGWDKIATPTPAMALVVFVDFDEPRSVDERVVLEVACLDASGVVSRVGPGGKALKFQAPLNGGEGATRALATIEIGSLELEPGRYNWNVSIVDSDVAVRIPFEAISEDIADFVDG